MKILFLISLFFISLSAFSQKDSAAQRKFQEELLKQQQPQIPDTVIFKIPQSLVVTMNQIMKDEDFGHKLFLLLRELWYVQVDKQLIKPKK